MSLISLIFLLPRKQAAGVLRAHAFMLLFVLFLQVVVQANAFAVEKDSAISVDLIKGKTAIQKPSDSLDTRLQTLKSNKGTASTIRTPIITGPISYKLLHSEAQDPRLFVQGFEISDQSLYISSGRYGLSALFKESIDETIRRQDGDLVHRFHASIFAEGLSIANNHIYVLSWRSQKGFVFDKNFGKVGEFSYPHEGWGIAHEKTTSENAKQFIVSDGTSTLRRYLSTDISTFDEIERFTVSYKGASLTHLNELELVDDLLFINQFGSHAIIVYDLKNYRTIGLMDLSKLSKKHKRLQRRNPDAVLNGIAYDSRHKALWVTGKLWPKRYLIKPEFTTSHDHF